jgi:CMP-N,N'-diacetyllegionaminic acid synthase
LNILITICARGGSKGIPGKNIRKINGIPLIHYSIESAKKFGASVNAQVDIALSTDSREIMEVASKAGLETNYNRPENLSTDQAGKVDAIIDVKQYYESANGITYDLLLDLDVSSPLRSVDDLVKAYEMMNEKQEALNLFSVSNAHKNPYFNLVEKGEDGFFHLSKTLPNGVLSRQSAPPVYELNASFYFYRKAFFDAGFRTVYSGKALAANVDHICFDLDSETDFLFMEYLMVNNLLDFSL